MGKLSYRRPVGARVGASVSKPQAMPGAILELPRWGVGQNESQRRMLCVNPQVLAAQRRPDRPCKSGLRSCRLDRFDQRLRRIMRVSHVLRLFGCQRFDLHRAGFPFAPAGDESDGETL